MANIDLELVTDSLNISEGMLLTNPIYNPINIVTTDENGIFKFDGVFVDHPIKVSFKTRDDINVTTANLGNDETLDSDFHLKEETNSFKLYLSDGFIIEEGGIKNDIGLGIIEE